MRKVKQQSERPFVRLDRIDPVEWSRYLDKLVENPSAFPLTEFKTDFIQLIKKFDSIELCTSQTLAFINQYCSEDDIREILESGFLRLLTKTNTSCHKYPKLHQIVDAIEKNLRTTLMSRVDMISIGARGLSFLFEDILTAVRDGMNINGLGENGLGFIHELMGQDISDQELNLLLPLLNDTQFFNLAVDFNLRDRRGCTVLHHAALKARSAGFLEMLIERKGCDPDALNREGKSFVDLLPRSVSDFLALLPEVLRDRKLISFFIDSHSQFRQSFGGNYSLSTVNVFSEIERCVPDEELATVFFKALKNVKMDKLNFELKDLIKNYPRTVRLCYQYFENLLSTKFTTINSSVADALKNALFFLPMALEAIEKNQDAEGVHAGLREQLLTLIRRWLLAAAHANSTGDLVEPLGFLTHFSPEDIIATLEMLTESGETFLSYLKRDAYELSAFALSFSPPEILDYLLRHGYEINQKVDDQAPLDRLCAFGNFEQVVQLIKRGAKLNCIDSEGRVPLDYIDREKLKPDQMARWDALFESRVGLTVAEYKKFEELGLEKCISLEDFVKLNKAIQARLLEAKKELYDAMAAEKISVYSVLNSDPNPEKPFAMNFFIAGNIGDLKEVQKFNAVAFELALQRRTVRTGSLFKRPPRDVVKRILFFASPTCLTGEEANYFSDKMLPREKQEPPADLRGELIQKLKDFLKSPQENSNLPAAERMRAALEDPSDENLQKVLSLRSFYENSGDERVDVLYKNCLAIVDGHLKRLETGLVLGL